MQVFLIVLLVADVVILAASQSRGQMWADQICSNATMLCSDVRVPLVAAVIFGGLVFLMKAG